MKTTFNNKNLKEFRRKLRRNQTEAESLLWSRLRNRRLKGFRFVRQYSVGRYILDFYCPKAKLGIELDGSHHAKVDIKEYDEIRTQQLNSFNIKILRF